MRDLYTENKGFVGPKAGANATFYDYSQRFDDVDIARLAKELGHLRTAMMREASQSEDDDPEQMIAVGTIAGAEKAAKGGDASATFGCLKRAGKWALEMATKIGASVAAKAIEDSIGLPSE
jgi:hypothetical protein